MHNLTDVIKVKEKKKAICGNTTPMKNSGTRRLIPLCVIFFSPGLLMTCYSFQELPSRMVSTARLPQLHDTIMLLFSIVSSFFKQLYDKARF